MARPQGHWLNRYALEDFLSARHLSKTEIAAHAGISLGTLSDLCAWRRSASITVARQLAAAVGCAPETLFPQLAESQRELVVGVKAAVA